MLYIFGNCELDIRRYALCRSGTLIQLGPKRFSVLIYLLCHRDRVVLKQELVDLLWPGQFVSDAALARCIASIRQTVGDTGKRQQIIQTLYGHGYRFVAAVEERRLVPPAGAVQPPSLTPFHRHEWAPDLPDVSPGCPAPLRDPDGPPPSAPDPLLGTDAPPFASLRVPHAESHHHGVGGDLSREPQEVTVLCGALAHATVLAAHLGPDAMYYLVYGFFALTLHAVQRYGGIIHAFLDDGFVALFGVPVPGEDQAQRALQAAIRLRWSLSRQGASLGAPHGEPVQVRLGLHTGRVVGRRIGTDQRMTYLVVTNFLSY